MLVGVSPKTTGNKNTKRGGLAASSFRAVSDFVGAGFQVNRLQINLISISIPHISQINTITFYLFKP
jgi:hypothetical protein